MRLPFFHASTHTQKHAPYHTDPHPFPHHRTDDLLVAMAEPDVVAAASAATEADPSSSSSSPPPPSSPSAASSSSSSSSPRPTEEQFFDAPSAHDFGMEALPGQFASGLALERDAAKALEMKEKGNACYRDQDFGQAIECYTLAIRLCPYQYDKEKELAAARRRHVLRREDEEQPGGDDNEGKAAAAVAAGQADVPAAAENGEGESGGKETQQPEKEQEEESEPFAEHKEDCAVYYCNRAACLVHLGKDQEAVDDCTVALKLKPGYLKALLRRAQACERLDKLEDALRDYKEIVAQEPGNRTVKAKIPGLEKECAARMEKLKEETLGKLKDLGNSVLSNFGLSLDNFKMQQDPSTGSYSISFNK